MTLHQGYRSWVTDTACGRRRRSLEPWGSSVSPTEDQSMWFLAFSSWHTTLHSYLLDDILDVVVDRPLVPARHVTLSQSWALGKHEMELLLRNVPGLWCSSPATIPQYPYQRADRDRASQRALSGEFADCCHFRVRMYTYQPVSTTAPSWRGG